MYHPYQSGSKNDQIFEMFTPANYYPEQNIQPVTSQHVREYFSGGGSQRLTRDGRFMYSRASIEGFANSGSEICISKAEELCDACVSINSPPYCSGIQDWCLCPPGPTPPVPTPPSPVPTPTPPVPPPPTPAPTKIDRDAPLFGYWYFTFPWQPYDTPCSGDGIPGSPRPDINNYIKIANDSGVFKSTVGTVKENTSFNLGIGVYEGAGDTWGSNFKNDGSSYTTTYKILNFGGWGACGYGDLTPTYCPGGPNVVWSTDTINKQANLIGIGAAGLTKIRQNGYNGISLDLEAVASWDGSAHTAKTFAKAIFDLYDGFDDKNFVRILTIPGKGIGGEQYTKQGGQPAKWCPGTSMMDWFPIFMQMEQSSKKKVFEKLCLMEYGKGLDTEITEMGIGDVDELISNLTAWNKGGYLSGSPKIKLDPSRICLGLSFGCNNWWDNTNKNYYFKDRLHDVFSLASGGIHVWGKNAPAPPPPYQCGKATSIQDCSIHPNCKWGRWSPSGPCACLRSDASGIIPCVPTPPPAPTPPTPAPAPGAPTPSPSGNK